MMINSMARAVAKRSALCVGYASLWTPALQRVPRPCRPVQDLQAEHSRIHDTMRSFDRMLRVVQSEMGAGRVSASRLKDLSKFLTFSKIYGEHHFSKQTVLLDRLQQTHGDNQRIKTLKQHREDVAKTIQKLVAVRNEEKLGLEAETEQMARIVKQLCKVSETFPELEQLQFAEPEAEFLDRAFEEMDSRKSLTISAMEGLSDELIDRYKI